MSFDEPSENLAWAEDEGFQFELWSDTNRELATIYDAGPTASTADRVTKLLGPSGDLKLEYLQVNFTLGTHPQLVLDDIDRLWPNLEP